jgi:hypothetical protein
MKASEIRVGNWFRYPGLWSYRQPEGAIFSEFDFQWEDRDWFAVGESMLFLDEVLPIPLTEEWLIKFGFEKIKKESYVNGFEFILKPDSDLEFNGIGHHGWLKGDRSLVVNTLCRGNYVCNTVGYVHQLQNLYFALTGEELKAKTIGGDFIKDGRDCAIN